MAAGPRPHPHHRVWQGGKPATSTQSRTLVGKTCPLRPQRGGQRPPRAAYGSTSVAAQSCFRSFFLWVLIPVNTSNPQFCPKTCFQRPQPALQNKAQSPICRPRLTLRVAIAARVHGTRELRPCKAQEGGLTWGAAESGLWVGGPHGTPALGKPGDPVDFL